jgi:tRNA dimethylallyltransferase
VVRSTHVALVGTTASGKSALALEIARRDPTWEIVSIDSMQVYRGMDIGTAKPTPAQQAEVPHHLIDLVEPCEDFSVVDFRHAYDRVIADIEARGRRGLLVGGTGLHLRAVVDRLEFPDQFPEIVDELDAEGATSEAMHARLADLDPLAASRIDPANQRRVVRALEVTLGSGRPFSSFGPGLSEYPPSPIELLGLRLPASTVRERIQARYDAQMDAGFLDEARVLFDDDRGLSRTAAQALGYRELLGHLRGEATLEEALQRAVHRTRRFARRQRSWFHRDPRISWFDVTDPTDAVEPVVARSKSLVDRRPALEDS